MHFINGGDVFISGHILDIWVDVLSGMYSADSTEVF